MAGLIDFILALMIVGSVVPSASASSVFFSYDQAADVVSLRQAVGSKAVEIPKALLLHHLMDSLRLYDWYFENKLEAYKFRTFPNPQRLTIESAVERRYQKQVSRLRDTVAFFKKRKLHAARGGDLREIEAKLKILRSRSGSNAAIHKVNDALFLILQDFVTSATRQEVSIDNSPVALIFDSYLRATPDLSFVRPTGEAQSRVEFMKAGVTQQQWFDVMGMNPSFFSRKSDCPLDHLQLRGVSLCPSLPVETMSIRQVYDFLDKVRFGDAKFEYSLPSLQERNSVMGPASNDNGWFVTTSQMQSHVAGTKPANSFGLFDLVGNLWEVTREDAFSNLPIGQARPGKKFTIVGGSWIDRVEDVVQERVSRIPTSWTCYDVGFRLVRRARESL